MLGVWRLAFFLLAVAALAQSHRMPSMRTPSGGRAICARCDAPAHLSASATLSPQGEPGEPMEISGTIYQQDGQTPAAGVILFVYHTDATGHYSPDDDPFAPRIKGWLRTGSDGHYSFRSIRPAPYPNHSEPAHIHAHIWSDTMPEHFLPEYWFDGDPLIKAADAARCGDLGSFSPIVKLTRGADGVWHGIRDIRLDQ
jgi:protocatechuate 3,4-dioxygenase, beta subunit